MGQTERAKTPCVPLTYNIQWKNKAVSERRGMWVWSAGEGVMGWQLGHYSAQYAQAPTNA